GFASGVRVWHPHSGVRTLASALWHPHSGILVCNRRCGLDPEAGFPSRMGGAGRKGAWYWPMADSRFIVVDEHPPFPAALSQALSASFDVAEILEAGSLDELTRQLETAGEIDLILLDLAMPGVHGVSGLLYLRAQHPEVPVVIVSASDDAATI